MAKLPKPSGIKLSFGEVANMGNLNEEDQVFDLDCYYKLQKKAITDYLQTEAMRREKWGFILDKIKSNYVPDMDTPQYQLSLDIVKKAIDGTYRKNCPSKQKVMLWAIVFWISIALESSVLIVQGIFSGDFNPFIIVLAVLLGIGGFFQGNAIGSHLHYKWLADEKENKQANKLKEWGLFILGTILILLVSTIRASGSYDIVQFIIVFLITFFFGEAVAFSEAMHVKYKEQREWCIETQENACRHHAAKLHKEEIEKRDYEELYNQCYGNSYEKTIKCLQSEKKGEINESKTS